MTTLALPALLRFAATASVTTGPTVKVTKAKAASQVQRQAVAVTQDPSDEELISAICHGAEWALETLYESYHRYAYALAYGIRQENTGAGDIVQEVFLSVWRQAGPGQRHEGGVVIW